MTQIRRSTDVRKHEIIDAARKLITEKGSEHLTIRKIGEEVGISEAAIYRHFRSKREILSFLMNNVMASVLEEIRQTSPHDSVSLDALYEILSSHLSEIEQRRGVSFQLIAETISFGDKSLDKEVYDNVSRYIFGLKELMGAAVRCGCIRDDIDMDASATLLFSMIQGLVNMWTLGNYCFDLSQKFDALWSVFREAVAKSP